MGSRRKEITYGMTPQQHAAANILLKMVSEGNRAYPRPFTMPEVSDVMQTPLSGADATALSELTRTGFAPDTSAVLNQIRTVGREEVARAFEGSLARAGAAGSMFGTAARAAAAKAATGEAAKYEQRALELGLAAQEGAAQRRVQGLQLAAQINQAAQSLNLDAARLRIAAAQFQQGMDYEEWKRQNPDVFSLLGLLYGKNVDMLVSQRPDQIGPTLLAIATIVGGALAGSDARWKKNIRDLESVLDRVLRVRTVRFQWIEEREGREDLGVIAQEIKEIFPDVVVEARDGHYVDYWKVLIYTLKALQELAMEVRDGNHGNEGRELGGLPAGSSPDDSSGT